MIALRLGYAELSKRLITKYGKRLFKIKDGKDMRNNSGETALEIALTVAAREGQASRESPMIEVAKLLVAQGAGIQRVLRTPALVIRPMIMMGIQSAGPYPWQT